MQKKTALSPSCNRQFSCKKDEIGMDQSTFVTLFFRLKSVIQQVSVITMCEVGSPNSLSLSFSLASLLLYYSLASSVVNH